MFKLRQYQQEAEYAILNYLRNKKAGNNPVIVMPTGTGKSLVIGSFIKNALCHVPNTRIMMLTHVKELIVQNAEKLKSMWPNAPIGVYSAGLNSRDMCLPVIFGGVQSVAKAIKKINEINIENQTYNNHFGYIDLLIVDECHLIGQSENAQYNYVISELKKTNPYLRIIGFTATPFRLKQGMITDEGIFTDIAFNISDIQSFNRLIEEGFLCPAIPKRTDVKLDFSNVKLIGGEFSNKEVDGIVNKDEVLLDGVREMIGHGHDRKSWLTFASSIETAEKLTSMLNYFGIESAVVHSKLPAKVNDERLAAFKAGELKSIVNKDKLTTGFDHPAIDLIGVFRPTMSPALWVQMIGRGTRIAPDKSNCLVMDFAGNAARLGPINDPIIPGGKKKKRLGDAPIKTCPNCSFQSHASARHCDYCGHEFEFKTHLYSEAGTDEIIRTTEHKKQKIEYFKVFKTIYNVHEKKNKDDNRLSPPMLKVTYFAGLKSFDEYVLFEHGGIMTKKAHDWWKLRSDSTPPITTFKAIEFIKNNKLRQPDGINVRLDEKYPEIISYEW